MFYYYIIELKIDFYQVAVLLQYDTPHKTTHKTKLRGLSLRANYSDRETAAVGEVSANVCE
jgi:hypothetical protein